MTAAAMQRIQLKVVRDGEAERDVPLDLASGHGTLLIGRADDCAVRLDDRAVSRRHAELHLIEGGSRVRVRRKSEFAPIQLNGEEREEATLSPGDVLSVGPYRIRLVQGNGTASIAAQTAVSAATVGTPVPMPVDSGPAAEFEVAAVGGEEVPLDAGTSDPEGQVAEGGEFALESAAGETEDVQLEDGAPTGSDDTKIAGAGTFESVVGEPEGQTRVGPISSIEFVLRLSPGTADVDEYRIDQEEVRIGRGKSCDLTLKDKKASRVHAILRRAGMRIILADQGSSHGTFVNNERITEQEIFSDDVIQIGESRLTLVARDPSYEAAVHGFAQVPAALQSPGVAESETPHSGAIEFEAGGTAELPELQGVPLGAGAATGDFAGTPGMTPGIPGAAASGKKTLLQRFRELPPDKQRLVAIGAVLLAFLLTMGPDEDEKSSVDKAKGKAAQAQKAGAASGPKSYEQLSEEDKAAVDAAFKSALNFYTTGQYEPAIREAQRVLSLVPDHVRAKEIERYSMEAKRVVDAKEEENRKKQAAEELRERIRTVVAEVRTLMEQKKYEEAARRFPEVQELDADNTDIARWMDEIREHRQREEAELERKRAIELAISQARQQFDEAEKLRKAGRFKEGIVEYAVLDAYADYDDPQVRAIVRKARAMIEQCRKGISDRRDPLLEQGRTAEESGDFAAAYAAYEQAKQADPDHPGGQAGMDRVRAALNARAKTAYTEAVLAESYSDYSTAKSKFEEVLRIAPRDDKTPEGYYGRARRRLASYLHLDSSEQSPDGGARPAGEGEPAR